MHIEEAAYAFALEGAPMRCKEFGHGHINTTWKVTADTGAEYVLQKINTHVFRDPARLMENLCAVTDYLRQRVEDPRQALHFVPARDGSAFYRDGKGQCWRMYDFIDGFCLDLPETEADLYESALAFGRFQELLADFPAHTLHETIPEFHNTVNRYQMLRASVAADPLGRAKEVQPELDYLFRLEQKVSRLQQLRLSGALPLRVTHNDTKLNNVLLDRQSRKSLCVLDLDTVMPGLSAYDYGDSIRFGAATAAEDEPDASKMGLDLGLFRVYTQGFLEAAPSLTELEVQLLPLGALTMTAEVAVRFLKDDLDGDVYFKTQYPRHNLVRTRSQIALARDMERKWEEMNRIVAEVALRVRGR